MTFEERIIPPLVRLPHEAPNLVLEKPSRTRRNHLQIWRRFHYIDCMLNRYLSIFLICMLLGGLLPASLSFSAETPSSESLAVSIDISGLTSLLATLSPDEKDEQVRDWAVYGLMKSLGLTVQENLPVRISSLKGSLPGEVSLGRVFPLSAKEWGSWCLRTFSGTNLYSVALLTGNMRGQTHSRKEYRSSAIHQTFPGRSYA